MDCSSPICLIHVCDQCLMMNSYRRCNMRFKVEEMISVLGVVLEMRQKRRLRVMGKIMVILIRLNLIRYILERILFLIV